MQVHCAIVYRIVDRHSTKAYLFAKIGQSCSTVAAYLLILGNVVRLERLSTFAARLTCGLEKGWALWVLNGIR